MPSELDFDTIQGLSKWRSELETDIYFENVFGNISKITYDNKLQNFQYKLLHRIPTNTEYLYAETGWETLSDANHFFFVCTKYSEIRNDLFLSISDLSQLINTLLLTSGSETLSYADNCFIFDSVFRFIKRSKRFLIV